MSTMDERCQRTWRAGMTMFRERFRYRQHRCGLPVKPPHTDHVCRYCGATGDGRDVVAERWADT